MRAHSSHIRDIVFAPYERRNLRNKNFTIISNDCIAAGIYRKLGLNYTTPTIGLFFFAEDYIKFLENLEYYLKQTLTFCKVSRHVDADSLFPLLTKARKKNHYPIGLLGNDVEIHFLHYLNEREAMNKWQQRVKRINFENLFIIYSDKYRFQEEYLDRFEKLPFEHKIFLSAKPRRDSELTVFLQDYADKSEVGDLFNNRKSYEKSFDTIKWLNCNRDFINQR